MKGNDAMPQDILFKNEDYVFSFRVAGILERDGCVLLQQASNDPGYAFPGGHAEIGETGAQTLEREFSEEMGVRIKVGELAWTGEIFFPWGSRPCHQICFYYRVSLDATANLPFPGRFRGVENMEGRSFDLDFVWVKIEDLQKIELYPPQTKEYLAGGIKGFQHFIYVE